MKSQEPSKGWEEIEGVVYPRVTHILDDVLNKGPGFLNWYLKHGKEEATKIALSAANFGTGFHQLVTETIKTGKPPETIEEKYTKRFEGFQEYIRDKTVESTERRVLNKTLGYTGTLDLLVNTFTGLGLIDIKTGTPRKEHELQLSAYRLALQGEGIKVDFQGLLWLPEDGSPVFVETEYVPKVFESVVNIFYWKHGRTSKS